MTVTPTGTFTSIKAKDNRNYYKFDGSTNYISLSDSAIWNLYENDFAICGWVQFTDITTNRPILRQYADTNNYVLIRYTQATNLLAIYNAISGTSTFYYTCPFTPSVNTWYHLGVIRSGSLCLMYISGMSQIVTPIYSWSGITNIEAVLGIGGSLGGTPTAGMIKDLMIFRRALNPAQIESIMLETYIS